MRRIEFHILLSLAAGERHGYGIIQDIEARGETSVPDVGTMCRSLARMVKAGLIKAAVRRAVTDSGDERRGVWTRYRITVEGRKARLYVHGASQPCLIVNDLKLGDSSGGVALWIGPGTEGYFTGLKIRAAH